MAIADTITSMQTHTSNAYSMIENGTDLTGTNKNLENLSKSIFKAFIGSLNNPSTLWGNLPKITGTGTNISLNNTIEAPMKIELSPVELTQDATPTPSSPQAVHTISGSNTIRVEGKNLADISNMQLGKAIIGGGVGQNYSLDNNTKRSSIIVKVKPSTQITLSVASGYYLRRACEFNKSDLTNCLTDYAYYSSGFTTTSTFTTKSNTNYVAITIQPNPEADMTQQMIDNCEFMVEYNSSKTTYEPYKGTDYSIDLTSKNLFDIDIGSQTISGIKFTVNADKSITAEGIATGEVNLVIGHIDNLPSGSYFVSGCPAGGTSSTYRLQATDYPVVNNMGYDYGSGVSFTSTGISYALRITIKNGVNISNGITFKPMINKGTTALPYVPYYDYGEYCKIGNYEDRIFKNVSGDTDYSSEREEGAWYIKKNIGKVVVDGTESNWSYNSSYNVFYIRPYYLGMSSSTSTEGYYPKVSNYFKYYASSGNVSGLADGIYENTSPANYSFVEFHCDSLNISTLADFKTWLGTNKPIIYYPLETPTYTKIEGTLANQLEAVKKSKDGVTNISQVNNDLAFVMSASAVEDLG